MPAVAVSAGAGGGASNGLGTLLVGSDQFLVTGAIEANVINRADPVPNTPLIDFGARRVGDAAGSAFVPVTNQASALPQAALNASIGGASSPFSASGSFMQLAPNATDATSLQVGLATGTAGNFSGGATIRSKVFWRVAAAAVSRSRSTAARSCLASIRARSSSMASAC